MDYLSSASRFLEAEHTVEHKSFVTPSTTHAGAVVFEGSGDSLKFLLVKANDAESHWVLPKGHIENGEDAWSAALREVREETGVIAKRDCILEIDRIFYSVGGKPVSVTYFLAALESESPSPEGRAKKWISALEAEREVKHQEALRVIKRAHALLDAKRC
ncbi:MAG: NUDIX domain-containing protein [Roseomonas sp.]|nr:NUDIX domain-containing protein [Roseomonas sp.]